MYHTEYLPHTADVRLHIEADCLEDLFLGGLTGMSSLLKAGICDQPREWDIRHSIKTRSPDMTTLLIDFLSDVLTLSHSEKTIFCQLEITDLRNDFIEALVLGSRADGFDDDIKAVTYHEAEIVQNEKGMWETVVIFDI